MNETDQKSLSGLLDNIRTPAETAGSRSALMNSALILFSGIALGIFSKWLDELSLDSSIWWHRIVETLDLGNVFSEFSVWFLIAAAVAVFSRNPKRAAVNTFLFFAGMCAAYHLYTVVFGGFNPLSYMIIWYGITLLSPVLAVICWYAKGSGIVAAAICSLILTVMARSCFSTGWFYIYPNGFLNILFFLGTVLILHKDLKRTVITVIFGLILSILLSPLMPF